MLRNSPHSGLGVKMDTRTTRDDLSKLLTGVTDCLVNFANLDIEHLNKFWEITKKKNEITFLKFS